MDIDKIEDLMDEACYKGKEVRAVDIDGKEYLGMAIGFSSADDEEDGYASLIILDSKSPGVIFSNEIKTIEIIN